MKSSIIGIEHKGIDYNGKTNTVYESALLPTKLVGVWSIVKLKKIFSRNKSVLRSKNGAGVV